MISALTIGQALAESAPNITGRPRIVDGDTITIGKTHIRLQGIDAPETDQVCLDAKGYRGPNGQCVGWKQLKSVCGTPPTTKCTPESVSPLVGADEKKAKK